MKIISGGVTAAKGFQATSTAAGIKYQDRTDMAMVYSEKPCRAAGTFTTNVVKAAPVSYTHLLTYFFQDSVMHADADTDRKHQNVQDHIGIFADKADDLGFCSGQTAEKPKNQCEKC